MRTTQGSETVGDDVLLRLAFQRGILTLLRDSGFNAPMVEKALEDIDYLLDHAA